MKNLSDLPLSNLQLRVLTALIGLPLVLVLLIYGGMAGTIFLVWTISTGMLFEFSKMSFELEDASVKTLLLLLLNSLLMGLAFFSQSPNGSLFFLMLGWVVFILYYLFKIPHRVENFKQHMIELGWTWLGWTYCAWLSFLLIQIRDRASGLQWLLFVFVVVWITDTGAYFAGRFLGGKILGKAKLYPEVSPKKTWEGSVGGTLLAVSIACVYAHYFLYRVNALEIAMLAGFASIASQIGDLFESLIKRSFGIKDSGNLLPGHGGFLDRFDGVLFAAPVVYFFLWLFY